MTRIHTPPARTTPGLGTSGGTEERPAAPWHCRPLPVPGGEPGASRPGGSAWGGPGCRAAAGPTERAGVRRGYRLAPVHTATEPVTVEDRDRGLRASREPAAGVMGRRRSGRSSRTRTRRAGVLRTAGLAQAAGPHRSPAPTGVTRRRGASNGHGWTGSMVAETTASRTRMGRLGWADSDGPRLGWAADQDALLQEL